MSVVLPVYNSMPYLTGAIESVLAQDLTDIEVIAIDDGSTDGSGEALDRFAAQDSRLSVIHQPNSGWPGMPRNRGLEHAGGRFVFFMDSDDTMPPHALRAMVEMADDPRSKRPADIVIPRFEGVGGRRVQSLFARYPQGTIGLERALESLSPQKLFRRELLEREHLRFPEGKVRLEDGIFVTQAYLAAERIAFCGKRPLYAIVDRDDGQNISAQDIEPAGYVASCRRIAGLLLESIPDRGRAELLIAQFFWRKGLKFYALERWAEIPAEIRVEWIELHRAFLRDLVPVELDAKAATPTDRRKLALLRAGDADGLEALIAAAPRLTHVSECTGTRRVDGGIEISVAVTPDGEDSLLREVDLPSRSRLRAADHVNRALRPLFGTRAGRGASRRLAAALTGEAPEAHLVLSGRRVGRAVSVPGRLVGAEPGSGELRFRFVLPDSLLQRYRGDRVDLWTVAAVDPELSGGRVRVRARKSFSKQLQKTRVYSTDQGNVSLAIQ